MPLCATDRYLILRRGCPVASTNDYRDLIPYLWGRDLNDRYVALVRTEIYVRFNPSPEFLNREVCMFERLQESALQEAQMILDASITMAQPTKVYALFSGGHDSLTAAHIASQREAFSGCVHIKTGIGIEETTWFVQDVCAYYGWPLKIYEPQRSYEDLVLAYGFPGPSMHNVMYRTLKERCLRQLIRDENLSSACRECRRTPRRHDRRQRHPWNPPCIALVSGVRRQESKRRMGLDFRSHREGKQLWIAPLLSWSSSERNAYIEAQHLPRNPVVEKLCMSGECLCGAFAAENEIQTIQRFYPDMAARIHALEQRAQIAGKRCIWGKKPEKDEYVDPRQQSLFSMCWSCGQKPKTMEEALLEEILA